MSVHLSRRRFVGSTAALSLSALVPRGLLAASSATQKFVVRAGAEIALVRPEFHGHFAEHLGSCVYGGLWVGKKSPIPNIDGYRKQAVDYLRELGIPVLRWPGGCYADDYHWRDGIGPLEQRPKRVNIPLRGPRQPTVSRGQWSEGKRSPVDARFDGHARGRRTSQSLHALL